MPNLESIATWWKFKSKPSPFTLGDFLLHLFLSVICGITSYILFESLSYLNTFSLFFLRLGAFLFLFAFICFLYNFRELLLDTWEFYSGLNNGSKAIFVIIIFLAIAIALLKNELYLPFVKEQFSGFKITDLNPIGNISKYIVKAE